MLPASLAECNKFILPHQQNGNIDVESSGYGSGISKIEANGKKWIHSLHTHPPTWITHSPIVTVCCVLFYSNHIHSKNTSSHMWFSSFFFSTFCRFPSLSNSSALSLASRLFLFSFHYSKYVGKCERKWKEKYFKATLSTFHFIFMKNYFYFTFTHSPIHTINLFSVFIVFNTSHHHRRPTPCHPQVHVFLFWHQSTNGCYAERTLFDERKSVFLFSGNSWWEIYFEITIIFHIYHIHRFSLSIYIFRSISALSVIASRGVAAADIVGAVIIKSTFAIQCVYVRKMRRRRGRNT